MKTIEPTGIVKDADLVDIWVRIFRPSYLKLGWRVRRLGLLAAMAVAFAAIYALAVNLRMEGRWDPLTSHLFARTLAIVVGLKLGAVVLRGSHRGWIHRATFHDIVSQAEAATLGSLAVAAVLFGLQLQPSIPRLVLLFDWCLTVLLLCGTRGLLRLIRERYYPMFASRSLQGVLVVGAGEASIGLLKEIQGKPGLGLRVVGLLADGAMMRGRVISGVKVLGDSSELVSIAQQTGVQRVLIPTPAIPPRQIRSLLDACIAADLRAQVVPGFDALVSGHLTVRPRDVAIEDLLCRDPVRLLDDTVARFLAGKVVLVTGGAGSIGSEIGRQVLAHKPRRVVLLDTNENGLFYIERELRDRAPEVEIVPCVGSITDVSLLRQTFHEHQPAIVVHAAAHKHVPMMEANPAAAIKNNAIGTRVLVDEAVRGGAEALVLISTDKAVNPTSVMGASKRLAEMYVQALAGRVPTRLVAVRFGNVLGSNGSVVPTFQDQIRRGGPVTVTHPEMTRFFMTIPEASQLVLQAGAIGRGGEVFVLDMGQPVRIVDLARDLIRLSGLEVDREIDIVYTGLRPGEKLYEELHDPADHLIPTAHPKIFQAPCPPSAPAWIDARLAELSEQLDSPPQRIIQALAGAVPGYRPGGLALSRVSTPKVIGATEQEPLRLHPIVEVDRIATSS